VNLIEALSDTDTRTVHCVYKYVHSPEEKRTNDWANLVQSSVCSYTCCTTDTINRTFRRHEQLLTALCAQQRVVTSSWTSCWLMTHLTCTDSRYLLPCPDFTSTVPHFYTRKLVKRLSIPNSRKRKSKILPNWLDSCLNSFNFTLLCWQSWELAFACLLSHQALKGTQRLYGDLALVHDLHDIFQLVKSTTGHRSRLFLE